MRLIADEDKERIEAALMACENGYPGVAAVELEQVLESMKRMEAPRVTEGSR